MLTPKVYAWFQISVSFAHSHLESFRVLGETFYPWCLMKDLDYTTDKLIILVTSSFHGVADFMSSLKVELIDILWFEARSYWLNFEDILALRYWVSEPILNLVEWPSPMLFFECCYKA